MLNIIDTLDNRMNPIVVKELRQGLQSRFIIIVVNLLLAALTLTCIMIVMTNPEVTEHASGGQGIFWYIYIILLVASMLCVPLYLLLRLRSERNGTHVDLFFTSTLKPQTILRGKFIAGMTLVTLLYSLCLPFMLFSYILRGYDIPTMLIMLLFCYSLTAMVVMGSLMIGSWKLPRIMTPFLVLVTLVLLVPPVLIFYSISIGIAFTGAQMFRETEFLTGMAFFLVILFLIAKLFEATAIGLLLSPSTNRTCRLRVWATISIVATLVLFTISCAVNQWLTSSGTSGLDFWQVLISSLTQWYFLSTLIIVATLIVAMCEPDGFSRRIMMNRPRRLLFRGLAFPYTHGASGGFLWAMIHLLAMTGFMYALFTIVQHRVGSSSFSAPIVSDIISRYVFMFACIGAYALLAKFFMRTVLKRLSGKFTWVVFLLLIAVFMLLSMMVCFALDPMKWTDNLLWQVFVPLPIMSHDYTTVLASIEIFWFLMMLTLCLPQGLRDTRRYLFEN